MKHFVLAITGPAGSGKSTVADKLAKQLPHCANIDADHVKDMVVDGFYVDEKDPQNPLGWGFNQWGLVGDSIGLLAANFIKHGYDVVINGYIGKAAWANIEKHVTVDQKILLLPSVAKVVERDAARPREQSMGEPTVTLHHQKFSTDTFYAGYTKLDTSVHSVDQTLRAIRSLLE